MTSYGRLGLFALATLTACDWVPQYCEGEPVAPMAPEAAPATPRARTVAQVLPAESTAVDILFVIDDSLSMADEQKQLGIWSREMFAVLAASGELPDLHVAVTSSSVPIDSMTQCRSTTGGTLHVGQAVLQKGRFLRDVAGPAGRERNYTGTLTENFAKLASVGAGGCGFEQPFKAARMALSGKAVGGEDFLRADALLLVVFVTDEDDCSSRSAALYTQPAAADTCGELGMLTSYRCFEYGVTCYDGKDSRELGSRSNCHPNERSAYVESVLDFADFLKGLKENPAQVVVSAIYGKPNGITAIRDERVTTETPRLADVCGGTGVEGTGATPAVRMNALLAEFGGRASQSSICESELSWAMREVGLVTRGAATRSRCLRGALADLDAAAPGLQPACRVEVARHLGTGVEERIAVPPCGGADGQRCFTVDVDATCGETETKLAVQVADPADDETLTVDCDVPGAD